MWMIHLQNLRKWIKLILRHSNSNIPISRFWHTDFPISVQSLSLNPLFQFEATQSPSPFGYKTVEYQIKLREEGGCCCSCSLCIITWDWDVDHLASTSGVKGAPDSHFHVFSMSRSVRPIQKSAMLTQLLICNWKARLTTTAIIWYCDWWIPWYNAFCDYLAVYRELANNVKSPDHIHIHLEIQPILWSQIWAFNSCISII